MTRDIERALCEAGYAPLRDYVKENTATEKPKASAAPSVVKGAQHDLRRTRE